MCFPYTFFTVSWHTAFLAQDIKQKYKSAPDPHLPGSDIKQTKKPIPGSLRPCSDCSVTKKRPGSDTKQKGKRAPGPKRYQATKFEVCQLTVKNVQRQRRAPNIRRLLTCTVTFFKKRSLKTECFSLGGLVVQGYWELMVIVEGFLGAKYLLFGARASRFMLVA